MNLRSSVTTLDTLTLEIAFNPVVANSASDGSKTNSSGVKLVAFWEEIKHTVISFPI